MRWFVALALLFLFATNSRAAEIAGPLDRYVAAEDKSYQWSIRREQSLVGGQATELVLTSQTWRDIPWKHRLFIYRPPQVRDPGRALFMIAGGRWRDEYAQPPKADETLPKEATILAGLANQMQTPVAVLLNVPQQPIFEGMVEDQIIAYTFEQFIKTKDDTWPLLLPMVKSAVRGMDAMQELTKSRGHEPINRFMVTGASKRGWTTWLTAVVDPRVDGLAPMVIDMLNMAPQMEHSLATWGKFSDQIHDYTDRGIPQMMKTPQGQSLTAIVDPYAYRDRIVQPKLIMLGTNDRYWPLDALNVYWDGLQGEKFVLYVPNQGHGLADFGRVLGTMAAFQRHVSGEVKFPSLTWKHETTGERHQLTFTSSQKPTQVLLWTTEAATRDFRDAKWQSRAIEASDGSYRGEVELPKSGFRAVLAEGQFSGGTLPYYLSTNVQIVGAK